jgi:aminoglycoside phosphotransferase (APT) family kinase protein
MAREFKVLSALKPVFPKVPAPLLFCDDITIIGSPFYIMERIKGIILRNKVPPGIELGPATMHAISIAAIDQLAALHTINLESSGLLIMGKPGSYKQRQVEGWIKRYEDAKTDKIQSMDFAAEWMRSNMPTENEAAFIHNDYKYDNLLLDPVDMSRILAILDWEMATVGDPLMDLGTSLAYWCEATDPDALKPFNLTWLPGNLSREEVVEYYANKMNITIPQILFYYVFGSFKIGVIVQQIYARYKKGFTNDDRFAGLLYVVKACADNAKKAITYNRISHFY